MCTLKASYSFLYVKRYPHRQTLTVICLFKFFFFIFSLIFPVNWTFNANDMWTFGYYLLVWFLRKKNTHFISCSLLFSFSQRLWTKKNIDLEWYALNARVYIIKFIFSSDHLYPPKMNECVVYDQLSFHFQFDSISRWYNYQPDWYV